MQRLEGIKALHIYIHGLPAGAQGAQVVLVRSFDGWKVSPKNNFTKREGDLFRWISFDEVLLAPQEDFKLAIKVQGWKEEDALRLFNSQENPWKRQGRRFCWDEQRKALWVTHPEFPVHNKREWRENSFLPFSLEGAAL